MTNYNDCKIITKNPDISIPCKQTSKPPRKPKTNNIKTYTLKKQLTNMKHTKTIVPL